MKYLRECCTRCSSSGRVQSNDIFLDVVCFECHSLASRSCCKSDSNRVLMDVIFHKANVACVLKQLDKKAKVIVVSAVGQDSIIKQAKELGVLDYIVKPADKIEVLEKVHSALK